MMKFFRAGYIFALMLLAACARQIAPSGGPTDTTPPRVLASVPKDGAVRVPRESIVEFTFSEKIDRQTFPEAIYVSPSPGEELKFKYKGNRAQLRFPAPLLENRTYVVTLGTDIRDNHGVAMEASYTLAFSTGDSIDRGEITGRVIADKPQGIILWAYILPDSGGVDPQQRGGDYVTQAGVQGSYKIPYIARGKYRIFAVNDQARNGVYDRGEDQIGIPFRDVEITAAKPSVQNMNFRLLMEDTLSPVLSSASLISRVSIEARFDEEVAFPDSLWTAHFALTDLRTGQPVPILAAARFPLDPRVVILRMAPLDSVASLSLRALDLTDLKGNVIDTAFATYEFGGTIRPDTLKPKILRAAPADSAGGIPFDAPIRLIFSEWMQTADSVLRVTLLDSAAVAVPGTASWENPFELVFRPDTLWQSQRRYSYELVRPRLRDLAENALFDTLQSRTFTTMNIDTLSSIAGQVGLLPPPPDSTTVILLARQVKGGDAKARITLPAPGPYTFSGLLPGVYMIEGFVDANKNAKYDYGRLAPFQFSERYFVYSDSIKIRSKWPNEGNNFIIKY